MKKKKEYHSDKVTRYLNENEEFIRKFITPEYQGTYIAGWRAGASMALFMDSVERKCKKIVYNKPNYVNKDAP